jgi:surface polysaccharide O-acyltransferase-like enzyme
MVAVHPNAAAIERHDAWVDNLRVLVIAGVIVVHTATAYVSDVIGWYYDDEQAVTEPWSSIAVVPAFFLATFALGPLFLIAGWYSARSIERRGIGGFVRTRLLRLGVPILLYVLLLQPFTDYLGNRYQERGSFWYYFCATEVAVMWFATALLVISLGYAGWASTMSASRPERRARPLTLALAARAAAVIAVTSFALWLVWPLEDEMLLNLRVPAWPQGAVLFALGVLAARAGWLDELPPALMRRSGWTTLAATAALMVLLVVAFAADDEELATRGDLPTALFAAIYGVIAVAWALWCVAWMQRRWATCRPVIAAAARSSYATYFIHPLVLTGLMLLCRSIPLESPAKFLLVSAIGVPTCFAVGHGLCRLPGASRVL